jgi:beta-glucosidase
MSDWFATKTTAPSANGGLDLVMPGPFGPWGPALVAAVNAGEVEESVIDDHLERLLLLADRVGALGVLRDYPQDLPAPDGRQRGEQLTRLAASGITVLTNRDAALPLTATTTIALIGRHAVETTDMGGGSAQVNAPHQISVAEGLTALLGDGVTVTDGVEVRSRPVPARPGFVTDPGTGEPGVAFTLLAADGSVLEERHSTSATTLVGFDDDFDGFVHSVRLRARLNEGGLIEIGVIGVGAWELHVGGQELHWHLTPSGTVLGEEVLKPPADTTQVTAQAGDLVEGTLIMRPGSADADDGLIGGFGTLGLIARRAPREQDEVIAEAVAAAASADLAVVVVGLTEEQETEAVDKSTLHLPGRQDDLVRAVAAAARKTVVVVNAATPAIMPWVDDVDAVLWAGLPGQEGGHAVAAALLGTIEPAGRLVTTFPTEDEATPAWSVTPVDGQVGYHEGTFIGYRGHHAKTASPPAFWFGHGLGYATWEYSTPRLVADADLTVALTVINTGARPSREVVQVYFEPDELTQPVRLVGWTAIEAGPGASADVTVVCDRRLWRRWDATIDAWTTLPDDGRLLVARGLGDIRGTITL